MEQGRKRYLLVDRSLLPEEFLSYGYNLESSAVDSWLTTGVFIIFRLAL